MWLTTCTSPRWLLLALLLLTIQPAVAQELDIARHSWDVFLRSDISSGGTELIFSDLLTGDVNIYTTQGERFALVGGVAGGVVYFDREEGQVKLATPEDGPRDHPFIALNAGDYRVDWTVSSDGGRIAWTVSRQSADGQLISTIFHADAAGADIRHALTYGPRPGLRLAPVAFSAAADALYVDVHPEGTGDLKPYIWHTGMFSLDLADGAIAPLPGNANCLCAVGFGGDRLLRLAPNAETNGLDIEVHDLAGGADKLIPSVSRGNYDEAGNLLVSPDGALAVYALSQVSAFRTPQQEIRTVLVMVDLENGRQVVINNPMPALLRPVKWTEDNSAILFTADGLNGAWKISLVDGQSLQVAEASYLGTLNDPRADASR